MDTFPANRGPLSASQLLPTVTSAVSKCSPALPRPLLSTTAKVPLSLSPRKDKGKRAASPSPSSSSNGSGAREVPSLDSILQRPPAKIRRVDVAETTPGSGRSTGSAKLTGKKSSTYITTPASKPKQPVNAVASSSKNKLDSVRPRDAFTPLSSSSSSAERRVIPFEQVLSSHKPQRKPAKDAQSPSPDIAVLKQVKSEVLTPKRHGPGSSQRAKPYDRPTTTTPGSSKRNPGRTITLVDGDSGSTRAGKRDRVRALGATVESAIDVDAESSDGGVEVLDVVAPSLIQPSPIRSTKRTGPTPTTTQPIASGSGSSVRAPQRKITIVPDPPASSPSSQSSLRRKPRPARLHLHSSNTAPSILAPEPAPRDPRRINATQPSRTVPVRTPTTPTRHALIRRGSASSLGMSAEPEEGEREVIRVSSKSPMPMGSSSAGNPRKMVRLRRGSSADRAANFKDVAVEVEVPRPKWIGGDVPTGLKGTTSPTTRSMTRTGLGATKSNIFRSASIRSGDVFAEDDSGRWRSGSVDADSSHARRTPRGKATDEQSASLRAGGKVWDRELSDESTPRRRPLSPLPPAETTSIRSRRERPTHPPERFGFASATTPTPVSAKPRTPLSERSGVRGTPASRSLNPTSSLTPIQGSPTQGAAAPASASTPLRSKRKATPRSPLSSRKSARAGEVVLSSVPGERFEPLYDDDRERPEGKVQQRRSKGKEKARLSRATPSPVKLDVDDDLMGMDAESEPEVDPMEEFKALFEDYVFEVSSQEELPGPAVAPLPAEGVADSTDPSLEVVAEPATATAVIKETEPTEPSPPAAEVRVEATPTPAPIQLQDAEVTERLLQKQAERMEAARKDREAERQKMQQLAEQELDSSDDEMGTPFGLLGEIMSMPIARPSTDRALRSATIKTDRELTPPVVIKQKPTAINRLLKEQAKDAQAMRNAEIAARRDSDDEEGAVSPRLGAGGVGDDSVAPSVARLSKDLGDHEVEQQVRLGGWKGFWAGLEEGAERVGPESGGVGLNRALMLLTPFQHLVVPEKGSPVVCIDYAGLAADTDSATLSELLVAGCFELGLPSSTTFALSTFETLMDIAAFADADACCAAITWLTSHFSTFGDHDTLFSILEAFPARIASRWTCNRTEALAAWVEVVRHAMGSAPRGTVSRDLVWVLVRLAVDPGTTMDVQLGIRRCLDLGLAALAGDELKALATDVIDLCKSYGHDLLRPVIEAIGSRTLVTRRFVQWLAVWYLEVDEVKEASWSNSTNAESQPVPSIPSPLALLTHLESSQKLVPDGLFTSNFAPFHTMCFLLGVAVQDIPAIMDYLSEHLPELSEDDAPMSRAARQLAARRRWADGIHAWLNLCQSGCRDRSDFGEASILKRNLGSLQKRIQRQAEAFVKAPRLKQGTLV